MVMFVKHTCSHSPNNLNTAGTVKILTLQMKELGVPSDEDEGDLGEFWESTGLRHTVTIWTQVFWFQSLYP